MRLTNSVAVLALVAALLPQPLAAQDQPAAEAEDLESLVDSLSDPDAVDDPVQGGQAFVAVRALQVAPWASDELWLAGYDANFVPSVGTGWVGRIALADVAATGG